MAALERGTYQPPVASQKSSPSIGEVSHMVNKAQLGEKNKPQLTSQELHHLEANKPEFTLVEGKPHYSIDQPFFWYYHNHDVTVYKPSPLNHAEIKEKKLPLAFEYLTKVTDSETQKDVYFRVITKGHALDIKEPPLEQRETSEIYVSDMFKSTMEQLRKEQSHRRSRAQTPTQIFTEREEYYYYNSQGKRAWNKAVFSQDRETIVQLVHAERKDPDHVIVPEDLPDTETLKRTMAKLNQRLNLSIPQKTIDTLRTPPIDDPLPHGLSEEQQQEESEKRKPFDFRGWKVYEQKEMKTDNGKLYTLRVMQQTQDGNTLFAKLLSAEPLREKIRELAEKDTHRSEGSTDWDFLQTPKGEKLVNFERVCSCMGARRGCDCYKQMQERLDATLKENGIMVLLQLDQSMGYGSPINAIEYSHAAELTNVLHTGEAPGKKDERFDTTMLIRNAYFGDDAKKDLTSYKEIGGLILSLFGPHQEKEGFYEMITDNKSKIGSIEDWGVKVKSRRSKNADPNLRRAKAKHLDYIQSPAAA